MFLTLIVIFGVSLESKLPVGISEICYKVFGNNKIIKLYALNSKNFYFERLTLNITQSEYIPTFEQIKNLTFRKYLTKTEEACGDLLEFGKYNIDSIYRSVFTIEVLYEKPPSTSTLEIFEFALLKDYHPAVLSLVGLKENFGMLVLAVNRTTKYQEIYNPIPPDDFWLNLPNLGVNQLYCLKFWNIGYGIVDNFFLNPYFSNLYKYINVTFRLEIKKDSGFVEKLNYEEPAELSLCEDSLTKNFNITLQNKNEMQRVIIRIESNQFDSKMAIYDWEQNKGEKYNEELGNWRLKGLSGFNASTAKEVVENVSKNYYVLFVPEKNRYNCVMNNFKGYYEEELVDGLILRNNSLILTPMIHESNIYVGGVMNATEIEDCINQAKSGV